jgi:hypothetical protein
MNTPEPHQKYSPAPVCVQPVCSAVKWNNAAKIPAPDGIYVLVADDYGRVHEGMKTIKGWATVRTPGYKVLWWADKPEHPGYPPNAEISGGCKTQKP